MGRRRRVKVGFREVLFVRCGGEFPLIDASGCDVVCVFLCRQR